MRRKVLVVLALAVWTIVSFGWGFMAYRNAWFPYHQLRAMAREAGIWKPIERAKPAAGFSPKTRAVDLRSLPYIAGYVTEHPEQKGILVDDESAAFPGYSTYYSAHSRTVEMIDMKGRVVWTWRLPYPPLHGTHVYPNGDLLAVCSETGITLVDKDSKEIWFRYGRFHHGFAIDVNGNIHAIFTRPRRDPDLHPTNDILADGVMTIDPHGKVLGEFSIADSILRSNVRFLMKSVADRTFKQGDQFEDLDLFHTNSVQVLDGSLASRSAIFARGNLLVSIRDLNLLVILDGTTHDVVWAWGPNNLVLQHDATLLPTGRILVFDNGVDHSQVLEVDPLADRITWRYARKGFFSSIRGSCQRLPNGNTLVTESNAGIASEVTPSGKIVWQFANPDVNAKNVRKAMYRVNRYPTSNIRFLPKK